MIIFISLYLVVSLLGAFTALTIGEYYEWNDNDYKYLYAGSMFLFWPVGIPLTFLIIVLILLRHRATELASYLKQK
ncbi:MAG: hypothetical protein EOO61_07000 [Hymenobacter sp.]|nr:MAG: hypothetical protein EOO61_07000 [Hymenobacter sp.]